MPDNLELPELPEKTKKGFSLFRRSKQSAKQDAKQEISGSSLDKYKDQNAIFSNTIPNKEEEIPPEKYFVLRTGDRIKNLDELKTYLGFMDEETFRHHVKKNKNDFANWIEHVFGKKELAENLRKCSTKDEMIDVLSGKEIQKTEEQVKKIEETEKLEIENINLKKGQGQTLEIFVPKENIKADSEKQERAVKQEDFVPDKLPEIKMPSEDMASSASSESKKKKPAIMFSFGGLKKEKTPEIEKNEEKLLPKIEIPNTEKTLHEEQNEYQKLRFEQEDKTKEKISKKIEFPVNTDYKKSAEAKSKFDEENRKYRERIKELESMLNQKKNEAEELKDLLEKEKSKLLEFQKKIEDKIAELNKRELDIKDKERVILQRFNELKSIKENLDLKEAEIVKRVNALIEEREMLEQKEKEIVDRIRELEVLNKKLEEEKKKGEERIRRIGVREQNIKQRLEEMKAFEKNLKEREKDVNRKIALIEKGREILKKMPSLEKNYKRLIREIPNLENRIKRFEEKHRDEKNFILNKTKELEAKEAELKQRELELEDKKEKLLKIQFRLLEEKNRIEEERLKLYIRTEKSNYEGYEIYKSSSGEEIKSSSELLKPLPIIEFDDNDSAIEEAQEAIRVRDFERAENLIKKLEEKYRSMPDCEDKKNLYYKILELRTDLKIATL